MAIGAGQVDCFGRVHGRFVGCGVTGDAAGGFAVGFFLGLATKRWSILRGPRGESGTGTKSEEKR